MSTTSQPHVVGRLAPSPTGLLHLGHAFSLLIAWWSARSQGGRVVLRIDDIDTGRSSQSHIDGVLRDLSFLGLDWDGSPELATGRQEAMLKAAASLLQAGDAYPCVCTRADVIRAQGAPQAGVLEVRYPGTCRDKYIDQKAAVISAGKDAGVRMRAPDEITSFTDRTYGKHSGNVQAQSGDFLIVRRDQMPSYQLGIVINDALDQVTEVVRGRDLLDSTLRQILLQKSLGLPQPCYAHVPLICDHTGRRLAKRESDLSLEELRQRGTTLAQIARWVARAAHQPGVEHLQHPKELVSRFDPTLLVAEDILLPEDPMAVLI